MPKIFKEAKENILVTSRRLLEEKGFNGFTMRDVAKATGYGVGTIYNYFPNKLSILASLVLGEWQEDAKKLETKLKLSRTFRDSIEAIYEEIVSFYANHRDLFFSVNVPSEARNKLNYGHETFLRAIERYVLESQKKFGFASSENDRYAACILLIQAPSTYLSPFENVYEALEKLLTGGKK